MPGNVDTLDNIEVTGIRATCIVGVYPHERETPQELRVDCSLATDTRRAALDEDTSHAVDYARVTREVQFLLESCRFHVLETAALALCRALFTSAPPLSRVRLRLEKPQALGDGVRAAVVVERGRDDDEMRVESVAVGDSVVDSVFTGRACAVFRVVLGRTGLRIRDDVALAVFDTGIGLAGAASASTSLSGAAAGARTLWVVTVPPVLSSSFATESTKGAPQ